MPKAKKYDYKICGDYTELYFSQKDGGTFTYIIDTEDLEKILNYKYKFSPNGPFHYLRAKKVINIVKGKQIYTSIFYQNWIKNFDNAEPKAKRTYYKNHNVFDCRKSNLDFGFGTRKRRSAIGPEYNERKIPYRSLCYAGKGWWVEKITFEGRTSTIRKFKDSDIISDWEGLSWHEYF